MIELKVRSTAAWNIALEIVKLGIDSDIALHQGYSIVDWLTREEETIRDDSRKDDLTSDMKREYERVQKGWFMMLKHSS